MTNEQKEKIRELVFKYVTEKLNWPKCSNEEVMKHLVPMWNILVNEGVTPPGMQFEHFASIAHKQYLLSDMYKHMGF